MKSQQIQIPYIAFNTFSSKYRKKSSRKVSETREGINRSALGATSTTPFENQQSQKTQFAPNDNFQHPNYISFEHYILNRYQQESPIVKKKFFTNNYTNETHNIINDNTVLKENLFTVKEAYPLQSEKTNSTSTMNKLLMESNSQINQRLFTEQSKNDIDNDSHLNRMSQYHPIMPEQEQQDDQQQSWQFLSSLVKADYCDTYYEPQFFDKTQRKDHMLQQTNSQIQKPNQQQQQKIPLEINNGGLEPESFQNQKYIEKIEISQKQQNIIEAMREKFTQSLKFRNFQYRPKLNKSIRQEQKRTTSQIQPNNRMAMQTSFDFNVTSPQRVTTTNIRRYRTKAEDRIDFSSDNLNSQLDFSGNDQVFSRSVLHEMTPNSTQKEQPQIKLTYLTQESQLTPVSPSKQKYTYQEMIGSNQLDFSNESRLLRSIYQRDASQSRNLSYLSSQQQSQSKEFDFQFTKQSFLEKCLPRKIDLDQQRIFLKKNY